MTGNSIVSRNAAGITTGATVLGSAAVLADSSNPAVATLSLGTLIVGIIVILSFIITKLALFVYGR